MQPEVPTVTRRELRAAARAQHRAPRRAALPTLDGLRIAARLAEVAAARRRPTAGALPGRTLTGLRLVVARPGCVALLSAAFLAGGVTQVTAEQHARDEHRAAVEAAADAAARAEAEHVRRVTTASATRLTQEAVAYAAHQRDTALAAAQAALETAGVVTVAASPVVAAEQMTPLDAAAAQLAALLEATPASTDVIPPAPTSSPTDLLHAPDADDVTVVPAPAITPTTTITTVPAADPATDAGPGTPLAATGTTAALVAAERSGGTPARSGAARTTATAPAATTVALVGGASAATSYVLPGAPLSAVAGMTPTTPVSDAPEPTTVPVPVRATPLASTAAAQALDLAVTAQVVAAAQQVAELSAQVEATAAANIAAAQAAAEQAAREQAAAAEAAARAASRSARVAAVKDGENGALPVEMLCGVDFARGVLLRCDAAAALEGLNEAYRAEFGRDLRIVSSYRDLASQVSVKATRGGLAASPGTSNHGWGLAVDFDDFGSLGQFDRPTYRWMREHAGAYGWHHPSYMQPGGAGPHEPWHWEYGTTD